MTPFERAIQLTLAAEGGYQSYREDAGNWTGGRVGQGELKGTNFGISAASYPLLDIKNLTLQEAVAIYQRDFWKPAACPQLPEKIAIAHFDAAVNCGLGAAAKLLQRAAGVPDDGKIGPQTLAAAAAIPEATLLDRMLWQRLRRYTMIGDASNSWRSWILRTVKLHDALTA